MQNQPNADTLRFEASRISCLVQDAEWLGQTCELQELNEDFVCQLLKEDCHAA